MLKGVVGGAGDVKCSLESCFNIAPLLEPDGLSPRAAQDMVVSLRANTAPWTDGGLGWLQPLRNRICWPECVFELE